MGTTLTGTTPQDTYDSLIKVTDNGPLSGTLKALSDGLGNDSTLSLSTTAASVAGTLAVSGDFSIADKIVHIGDTNTAIRFPAADTITFETSGAEAVRITSAGNVGIGTSSPSTNLDVRSASVSTPAFISANNSDASKFISIYGGTSADEVSAIWWKSGQDLKFATAESSIGATESIKVTITNAGVLDLAQGQIKFPATQVASADPNTLDDYEEGTWTMGLSFGGASTGIGYFLNGGTYIKIGRKVTVNGILSLTSKGSATGVATLTGLPFTIGTGFTYYSAPATTASAITSTGSIQGRGGSASTIINLEQHDPVSGANASLTNANFANNSDITISFTYFV